MRRFLAFVALFLSGLVLLNWIEPPDGKGERPAVGFGDEDGIIRVGPPGISLAGGVRSPVYDPETGRTILLIESEDGRTTPEGDELLLVELELYDVDEDPDASAPIRMQADSMLVLRTGVDDFEPVYERQAFLRRGRLEVERGLPLAPLEILFPSATVDARHSRERIIRSEDVVEVRSERLTARGLGMEIEPDADTLTIQRQGEVDFFRAGQRIARLESEGPIRLHRAQGAGIDTFVLEASEGGELLFEEREPVVVKSDRIRIQGLQAEGGDGLLMDLIEAVGSVEATSGESVFTGDRATVRFDDAGALAGAVLRGLPRARLSLRQQAELLPDVPPEELERVLVWGEGPLEITWGEERRFTMGGPAVLETPGATLRSQGTIVGWVHPEDQRAGFEARGGNLLETLSAVLETPSLDLEIEAVDGEHVVRGRATEGPRLVGTLDDGREFRLTSPDRLEVVGRGERWRVDDATDVVFWIEGPNGFEARAKRVERFEPKPLSLAAHGDVRIQNPRGRWTGERLEIDIEEPEVGAPEGAVAVRYAIEGTPETPARYVGYDGEVVARRVGGTGERFHAEGEVRSTLTPPTLGGVPQEYVLAADVLDVWREEEVEPDGRIRRTHRFDAQGNVLVHFVSVDDESRVQCEIVEGRHEEVVDGDEIVASLSHITATGRVQSQLVRDDVTMEFECRRLDLQHEERGDVPAWSRATAKGGVRFRTLADETPSPGSEPPPVLLTGLGEVFVLEDDGSGRLDPLPGQRVLVSGMLPSHDVPFEMDADDFTFLDGENLHARNPRVELTNLALSGSRTGPQNGTVHARAKELRATSLSLELEGDTRIDAVTARGVPWRLDCRQARFEGRKAPDDGRPEVRSLRAEGDVDLRLGVRQYSLDEKLWARATGDVLTGRSLFGTLRLSGDPVKIDWPGFESEVYWVEINPELRIVESMSSGYTAPRKPSDGRGGGSAPFGTNRQVLPQESAPAPEPQPAQESAQGPEQEPEQDPAQQQEPGVPQVVGGGLSMLFSSGWEFQWNRQEALFDADSIVYLFQEPRFRQVETRYELRASWMVLWLDRRAYERLPELLSDEHRAELEGMRERLAELSQDGSTPRTTRLFRMFRESGFGQILREVYFEGPVEILIDGALFARADAVYLDAQSEHGWLADATVNVFGRMVGQDFDKLIVKTHWLRHSADGSWRANDATVTPCDFDEPHLEIVTGDLQIRDLGSNEFSISLKDNRIELYDTVTLPLPPLAFSTDQQLKPLWETLRLGDSGRFGRFVSAGIATPAGKVGEVLNEVLGGDPNSYDASFSLDGSILGSRGVLGDLGMQLSSRNSYWMVANVGGVPDDGRDRGYIRVPRSERDTLRLWFRSHGRWDAGAGHTLDFSVTKMTDPGVQSEFFESDFERYERDESYIEWRKATGTLLTSVTVKKRLEGFRNDVEELPSVRAFRGRSPVGSLGPATVIHEGDARVQYLRRRTGDPRFQSPFGLISFDDPVGTGGFGTLDGAGDRDVLRFDVEQRLELQTRLGWGGLVLSPFVGGRFTAWDEGLDPEESPSRLLGQVGARLSTSFWKHGDGGRLHQLFPYVEASGDFFQDFDEGQPVIFDQTEDDPTGRFLEVGARARFGVKADGTSDFDVDLRSGYGVDLPDDEEDGWLPLQAFVRTSLEPLGMPIDLWHDGRFDVENRETDYALTAIGLRVTPDLRFELDHRRGRGIDGPLYEAATLGALFHWTDKWEFEARQTLSLQENQDLDSSLILRRFGHDWVFELESSVRQGEGGPSVSVSLKPRFDYRGSRLGYLSW